jgi:superkiller protein 3
MTEQLDKAINAMQKRKFKEAMKVLDSITAENPQDEHAILHKAFCFYHLKEFQQAVEWSQKAISLQPQNLAAYQLLSSSFHQIMKYPEAMSAIEKALEIDPSSTYSFQIKAAILLNSQKFPDLHSNSKEAVRLGAEYLKFTQDLDTLILDAKNNKEKQAENKPMDNEGPDKEKHQLAKDAIEKRRYKEAIDILDDLLRKNPNDLVAYLSKSVCLTLQKKYADAIQIALYAIVITPDDVRGFLVLCYALFGKRKYQECVFVINKALELDPNDLTLHSWLVVAYLNMGKRKDSYLESKKVYELHPTFATSMGIVHSFVAQFSIVFFIGALFLINFSVIFSSPWYLLPVILWYLFYFEEFIRVRKWFSLICLLIFGFFVAFVIYAFK